MSDGLTDGHRMSQEAKIRRCGKLVDSALGAVADLKQALALLPREGDDVATLIAATNEIIGGLLHVRRIHGWQTEVVLKRKNERHLGNLMALAQPGRVYRHYTGGLYTVTGLVRHHDTREWMVTYVSHSTGAACVRELCSTEKDSWTDILILEGRAGEHLRFEICEDHLQPK